MSPSDGEDESNKSVKAEASVAIPTAARSEDLVGHKIRGRFLLEKLLGEGRAGAVFLARDEELNDQVAIKILRDLDPKNIERFRREARSTRMLSHPNIVRIFEYGYEGDFIFIVMEYIKGKSLAIILEESGTLEPERASDLICQAARGFAEAHKKGIIHRDVNPTNLIVTEGPNGTESLKVVDFGLAKLIAGDQQKEEGLTTTGSVYSSPYYTAIEQVKSEALDNRSDIYSLGCVFFECLTGTPPFKGITPVATLMMHLSETPASLQDASGGKTFSAKLQGTVIKMLAKDKQERFQSMEELIQALDGDGSPARQELPLLFISHSSKDKDVAYALCDAIEKEPFKCWIAPRDIPVGASWPAEIVKGIDRSNGMILVYSSDAVASKHIIRELQEAERNDLPVVCFPIDKCDMSDEMRYLLSLTQWFMPKSNVRDEQFAELVETLKVTFVKTTQPSNVANEHLQEQRAAVNAQFSSQKTLALKEVAEPIAAPITSSADPPDTTSGAPWSGYKPGYIAVAVVIIALIVALIVTNL